MKTNLVRCMTMMAIAFWVSSAAANSIDVDLGASGVQLTIYDNDQSFGGPDRVLFSFTNYTGLANLVAVYIEGNGGLASIDSLYESSGVDFTTDQGGMANLQGAADFGSGAADFGLRAMNNATDGLDRAGEFLGVLFNLNPGVTLAQLPDIVVYPLYRCPLPECSGNNLPPEGSPVPEPASLILFGIGAGLAGLTKRRHRNK